MFGTRSVVSTSTERARDVLVLPASSVTKTVQLEELFIPVTLIEVIPL